MRPLSDTSRVGRCASASVGASGFSQNTGIPRPTAFSTIGRCSLVQLHTYATSQPSSTSSVDWHTWWPLALANATALGSSGSYTPARSASTPGGLIDFEG